MALSATFDKSSYDPGDEITLTVVTDPGERNKDVPITVHVTVAGLGDVDVEANLEQPPAAIMVSDKARIWELVSDDETTAVFTAIA